jgi:hypothetical protein
MMAVTESHRNDGQKARWKSTTTTTGIHHCRYLFKALYYQKWPPLLTAQNMPLQSEVLSSFIKTIAGDAWSPKTFLLPHQIERPRELGEKQRNTRPLLLTERDERTLGGGGRQDARSL